MPNSRIARGSKKGVMIVGAGPTGLTLALNLARYRVPFRIVERKPGISGDSKALTINCLSQYSFQLMGLKGKIGASGSKIRRINLHWKGRRLCAIDFGRLPFAYPFFLAQPQPQTERELHAALVSSGHAVEWGTRLLDFSISDGGISVVTAGPGGTINEESYSYLVGCDGKRSTVREKLGIPFTGLDYDMEFLLADVELAWTGSREEVHYFVYEDGFFILIPLTATHHRIVVKRHGSAPARHEPDFEEIKAVVRRHFGESMRIENPIWLSKAPFYMRRAGVLASGNAFLCGDACHLFSPIGGMGMNTGIQDAVNLAWKLAYDYHGFAGTRALLDSYQMERMEMVDKTAMATDTSTRLISRMETDVAKTKPFLPIAANRENLRKVFPYRYSGLLQAYSHSNHLPRQGDDFLEAPVGSPWPGYLDFHQALCAIPGFESDAVKLQVFVFGAGDEGGSEGIRDLIELAEGEYRDFLLLVFVTDAKAPAVVRKSPNVLAIHRESRVVDGGGCLDGRALLLRPDGVIAYNCPVGAIAGITDHLCREYRALGENSKTLEECTR